MAKTMAKAHKTAQRAIIAAATNMYLRTTPEGRQLAKVAFNAEAGEVVVVPACPEEPAVITFHRMEQANADLVILATKENKTTGTALLFKADRDKNSNHITQPNHCDLPGGMTTLEWVHMVQRDNANHKTRLYTANGSEFELDFAPLKNEYYDLMTV